MAAVRALVLFVALAACGTPPVLSDGPARPQSVTLYRDTVTVGMSDGSLCTGARRGSSGPWNTTLAGCPHPLPVEVRRPSPLPRLPLVRTEGDPWVILGPLGTPSAWAPLPPR